MTSDSFYKKRSHPMAQGLLNPAATHGIELLSKGQVGALLFTCFRDTKCRTADSERVRLAKKD